MFSEGSLFSQDSMAIPKTLRRKVGPLLLRPTAGGLEQALRECSLISEQLNCRNCPPGEARAIREALARLTPMARQAQQLYAALLAVEPSRDEAAANYTAQGRPGALAGGGRAIVDVIHG